MYRYYVKLLDNEQEVTREEFMKVERQAGFYPKIPGTTATHSFSSGVLSGRTVWDEDGE